MKRNILVFIAVLLLTTSCGTDSAQNGESSTVIKTSEVVNAEQITTTTEALSYGEPEGRILFKSDLWGGSDFFDQIFIVNLDGSDPIKVSNFPNEVGDCDIVSSVNHACAYNDGAQRAVREHLDWSPDGSQIVFTDWSDGDPEIVVMNVDGTGKEQLTNNGYDRTDGFNEYWSDYVDMMPSWSPDGEQIAFVSNVQSANNENGDYEIFVMNVDGTNRRQLTDNYNEELYYDSYVNPFDYMDSVPTWSPDGQQIAFVRWDGKYDPFDNKSSIYIMNVDGAEERQLISNNARIFGGLSWSPDGEKIVYEASIGNSDETDIWVVKASDGSGNRNLTGRYGSDSSEKSPAWSPNGNHIAFHSDLDRSEFSLGEDIYIINADGSERRKLELPCEKCTSSEPAWSALSD